MTTNEDPKATSEGPEATGGDKLERRGLMQSLTALCVRYVERLMPDPYLFAVILTLIAAALVALLVNGASPSGMLKAWYGGVWGSQNIFTFAFQMVLILVTGSTLAEAPVLKRAIVSIAAKPRNQVQGALLCFGVSAVLSLLNWGLGLVAGALVARQVAKRFTDAHFGYLIAAAFMGFIVWTQGLSSSIAPANTDIGSPINVIHKMTGITVPLKLTIFQPYSWLSVIVVLALLALAIWRMEPALIHRLRFITRSAAAQCSSDTHSEAKAATASLAGTPDMTRLMWPAGRFASARAKERHSVSNVALGSTRSTSPTFSA